MWDQGWDDVGMHDLHCSLVVFRLKEESWETICKLEKDENTSS